MAEFRKFGQEKKDPEKKRIPCRYFVRGFCRAGKKCAYSHEAGDIPVCRYYQQGLCYYGDTCWFRHPAETVFNLTSYLENYLVPAENFFTPEVDTSTFSNLNLLMAAAISSAVAETNNNVTEHETPKEPITVEKAMGMWKSLNDGGDKMACDSNKFLNDSGESLSAVNKVNVFYTKLEAFDIKQWSVEDAVDLLSAIADLDDVAEMSEDYCVGGALHDMIRLWKPTSKTATDFFCVLCESKKMDMVELLMCFVKFPSRVDDFDCYLGEVLFHMYQRKPGNWGEEWIASFLANLESDVDCCDVDVVDVLSSFGKLLKDPGKIGKLAHTYLLATGLQNSFECRCKTPECTCPVEVDEGVAFILFDGLGRRLQWSKNDKTTFFCRAVDDLFTPSILNQLGESMGIKNAHEVCKVRYACASETSSQANYTKCSGSDCTNNAKRECVNNFCGRCCKRSGLWCDVHIDLFPTRYQSVRAYDLLKPRVQLANRGDLERFLEAKEEAQVVCFGPQFSVRDDDVKKVIDLCKQLVVLELGSSDSGCGAQVTDMLVNYIAQCCPRLRKLRLESAHRVTDDAVLQVMRHCPQLESFEVSGNDKITGPVTDRAVKALFDSNVLPNLKVLYLTDQPGITYELVMRLRRCRSNVDITVGYTDSDSMAWSLILGMTGGNYGDGLF